jgi:hypothetical protein
MSETSHHIPAGAAAADRYTAADLAHFAGADELAAGAAVAGEAGRRLRARLLADELAAGHCVMMRLAARSDYAMTNAAGLGGRHALAFDLVAARFAGTAGRLMDQYRRGLLSLRRLDGAGDEEEGEWVGVGFEHQPAAAPEELERRLAAAKAARAAARVAPSDAPPPSPEEQAAVAAAEAVARRLTAEARVDDLGSAGAPDRARLFLDELSAGHRMMMRLAGRTDWQIDRAGAPAVDEEPTQRAILRLSSAMARLMERVRLGFLALERSPSDPGGGPRKVAGYYWTGQHDMLAHHPIGAPANDPAGRQMTDDGGQTASRSTQVALTQGRPTESPLPLGERDRVRGLARQREETSFSVKTNVTRDGSMLDCLQRLNGACRRQDPSPCPSPARGEGTLLKCRASPARDGGTVIRPLNRGRLKNGNPSGDYMAAPRCGAKTRAGCNCRQPAMANGRCRFHGGKSTGPRTAGGLERCRRARFTHGFRSAEVIDLRKAATATSCRLRALLSGAPPAGHGLHRRDLRVVAGTATETTFLPRAAGEGRVGASQRPVAAIIPLSAGHWLHRHDSQRCEPATGSRASRCNIRVHLRSSAAANL